MHAGYSMGRFMQCRTARSARALKTLYPDPRCKHGSHPHAPQEQYKSVSGYVQHLPKQWTSASIRELPLDQETPSLHSCERQSAC